jgi:UDP-2,3-diacylglucosamine hydrolase
MTGVTDEQFLGEDKEWLVLYAKEKLKEEHFDFFVFGHRHLPIDLQLKSDSRYINLGDWIKYNSYAEFDGTTIHLKYYQ